MIDIIERLRAYYIGNPGPNTQVHYPPICQEAANEIELLLSGNKHMCDELERLRSRVAVLEMVIQEELDEFDCCDEANRMIVENIHERGASVALPSDQRGGE